MVSNAPSPSAGAMTPAAAARLLGDLLKRDQSALLDNRRRLLGLLRDHAPSETRAIRLLMQAYDQGVPQALLKDTVTPPELKVDKHLAHFIGDSGLQPDLARFAVDVWNAALTGTAPKSASLPEAKAESAPPQQQPAVPVARPASDYTWGSEVVGAAPAQAAPTVAPPSGFGGLFQQKNILPGAIAIVAVLAVIGTQIERQAPAPEPQQQGQGEGQPAQPQPQPPQAQPGAQPPRAQPAPDQGQAQGGGQADGQQGVNVELISKDKDQAKWPLFVGQHPGGDPNAFQFQFNTVMPDNRLFIYNVDLNVRADGKGGVAAARGLDVQFGNAPEKVSATPSFAYERKRYDNGPNYLAGLLVQNWQTNPSNSPNLCIFVSTGPQRKTWSVRNTFFCVFHMQSGTCNEQSFLGCGRLTE